jgi:RecJ-like exonuclease
MKTQKTLITPVMIFGLWLALVLGCSTLRTAANSPSSSQNGGAPIKISAEDLYKAYESNEVAAADLYKGKTLIVSGTLGNIGEAMGSRYVFLVDDHQSPVVECFFADDQKDSLSRLKKGQTVSVKGTCQRRMGPVVLEECIIQ